MNSEDHVSLSTTSVPIEPVDDVCSAFLRRPINTDRPGTAEEREAVEPFGLPPTNEADHLLRVYFSTVNLMIPCIHEESFRSQYRKARSYGPRAVRRPWLGILNIVFAVATNVLTPTSPPIERATRSGMYFERAMELARPDMLRRFSQELGMLSIRSDILLCITDNCVL